MPPKSAKQGRMFGADLARARAGKPTVTGLKAEKLEEMAKKPPARKSAGKGKK